MTGRRSVLCGQGPAPAAASVAGYRALGLELVPGTGYLAACVPGGVRRVADAAARFRDVGARRRARVRDRLRPRRFPDDARDRAGDRGARAVVDASSSVWGSGPRSARGCATRCWRTPTSGSARSGGATREARIDAARDAFYRGFVAEAIVAAVRESRDRQLGLGARGRAVRRRSGGVLGVARGAGRRLDFRGWTVFKTGPWGQGPVFLQQLALLDGLELGPFLGVDHVHARARVREARVRRPRGVLRRFGAGAAGAAALGRRTRRAARARG